MEKKHESIVVMGFTKLENNIHIVDIEPIVIGQNQVLSYVATLPEFKCSVMYSPVYNAGLLTTLKVLVPNNKFEFKKGTEIGCVELITIK